VTDHKHRPGEGDISGFPEGTRIIHNPTQADIDSHVGAAEGSDLLGRHGRRFHLIEGSKGTAIEVIHFVERRGVLSQGVGARSQRIRAARRHEHR
jgi:hypothetical protein